ncbi:MAG: hypothetical protein ACJ71Z_09430 [Aeromicrobium sp.]
MSDNGPPRPRGAWVGGHIVVGLGWLICALAVGLVILEIALDTLSVAGVVLAVFVVAVGGTGIAVGRGMERAREL